MTGVPSVSMITPSCTFWMNDIAQYMTSSVWLPPLMRKGPVIWRVTERAMWGHRPAGAKTGGGGGDKCDMFEDQCSSPGDCLLHLYLPVGPTHQPHPVLSSFPSPLSSLNHETEVSRWHLEISLLFLSDYKSMAAGLFPATESPLSFSLHWGLPGEIYDGLANPWH